MVRTEFRLAFSVASLFVLALPGLGGEREGGRPEIASADSAFNAMEYERAEAIYQSELLRAPDDADLLWRMARLEICKGDIAGEDGREVFYQRGEEYARKCIAADSTLSLGHTWRAAALGSLAMSGSARRKVELTQEIKKELDLALALDPRDDGARSILGSFYRALGNISWIERQLVSVFFGGLPSGGFEEAEKELQTAIALKPGIFRHHYELALLYIDWERPEEAARALQLAIEAGPTMAADHRRIQRAGEQLARLR